MEFPAELGEKYENLGVLGQGGMGVVFRCTQRVIDRPVALKVLHAEQLSDEFIERFKQEARLASQLLHTNVVVAFDFGFAGRSPYIVFELVNGPSVREVLKKGLPPVELALDIVSQACEGLAAAHAKGIVHRDLKPENLLLAADGTLKIADFGIAKDQGREGLTQTGVLMGTPPYMSPEQARYAKISHATDIYSLGVVLFELLAGHVPFRGQTVLDTLKMHAEHPVPPLPHLHPALRTLVGKALAKMPHDRFKSATAFREELDHVAQMMGHEQTLRHHTVTRSFAADQAPNGTIVSAVAIPDARPRSRPAPTPVVPIGTAITPADPARAAANEGVGLVPFLLVVMLAVGGAWFAYKRQGALAPAVEVREGAPPGFGRLMRATSLAAIAYKNRADRVREDVLAPLNVTRDPEISRNVEAFKARETDPVSQRYAGALALVLTGLEESARTEFNAAACLPAPDGQVPAAWLLMNATLDTLALHQLELPAAASAAAEEQETRRGSPLRNLLRGVNQLKRANADAAAKAFSELAAFASGVEPSDRGVIDPSAASAAWFWAGLAQVLSAEKAADPANALRQAGASLARYVSGLSELPCGNVARVLLAQLDVAGLAPRGLTYPAVPEPAPFGPAMQKLVLGARVSIERVVGRKR